MAIDALPALPNRGGDPDNFSDDADAFFAALPTWTNQVNATAAQVDANALAASASATASATSATASSNAQSASESIQAIVVSAANFKGSYSLLTGALSVPASVYHSGNYWQLLENVANVTTEVPGVSSKWALTSNPSGYVAISTPFTITYPGRYLIIGNGTVALPNPSGYQNGVGFSFVRDLASAPTLQTVTDGFKWRGGLDYQIVMNTQAVSMVVVSSKYEV